MKKSVSILVMITGILFLSGCSWGGEKPVMDQASQDGNYHYRNKDLDFQVELPSTFEYYQTQRKEGGGYIDIEFLVPTSDEQGDLDSIKGYARPVVVRVFDQDVWRDTEEKEGFQKLEEGNGKVYAIKFWDEIPEDWQNKWEKEDKSSILDSFQL